MQQRELNIELRSGTGKGACRKLRKAGLIPGIVYGKGVTPVPVTIQPKALSGAIAGEGGRNNLITLKGGDSLDGLVVIVADLTANCLKGDVQHVDLHTVNMAEKLRVKVPVHLVGTAIGVKEGGMLDIVLHEIEVECLPAQIPEHLDVDVTKLTIGHSIHISELVLPEGLKVLEDPRAAVISILGRAKAEETAAE